MVKSFTVEVDLFLHTIEVVINPDIKEAVTKVEKKEKMRMKAGNKYFEGIRALCWDVRNDVTYIFLTDPEDTLAIAHECLHASWFIAKRVGLNFKKDDEAQAYIIEHIMYHILNKVKPDKIS